MKRKLLFVLGILMWMSWTAAPEVLAMRPGCGDGVCQAGGCQFSPPGTSPGDGCEEDLCSCYSDCQGMDPTYASGTDEFCDSCHGEAGTPDCYVCNPNWVFVSDTVVGYVEEDHWTFVPPSSWDHWCEVGALHHVLEHDSNECGGDNDRAYCWFESFAIGNIYNEHNIPWSGYCCWTYGCSGYQYCPYY